MDKTVYILRGLPGCGKSTYAAHRWPGLTPMKVAPRGWSPVVVSADHYFTDARGKYRWEGKKLGQAHADMHSWLLKALKAETPVIVVDNVHKELWEYRLTEELARAFAYKVVIIDLFDGQLMNSQLAARQLNTHQVPEDKIAKIRSEWEKDPRCVAPH